MDIKMNDTPTFIGTSGYNYDDWKGEVVDKDALNYDILNYYKNSKLNFLELTYTFYKIPNAEKIVSIAERLGDDIKVSIRLNKLLMRKSIDKDVLTQFKEGIKPLIDNNQAIALFADFHQLFTASRENFNILLTLRDAFSELPLFFELTNSTWHKERFYDEFKSNSVGLVTVDMPNIRGLAPYYPICSNGAVYLRLHGRSKLWVNPQDKNMDYSYSDAELKKIIADINDKSVFANKIFLSFCNVEKANAPKNAVRLMELL